MKVSSLISCIIKRIDITVAALPYEQNYYSSFQLKYKLITPKKRIYIYIVVHASAEFSLYCGTSPVNIRNATAFHFLLNLVKFTCGGMEDNQIKEIHENKM